MAILMYGILLAFMLSGSHAHKFTVDWKVPNDPNTKIYDEWAGRSRFQVGDLLVFLYNSNEDSVLRVTYQNYRSCNTSHPIATINRIFKLPHPGPFFFISGASGHCSKSQKLQVVVLAIRGVTRPSSPPQFPPVPAPAPVPVPVPAPAPVPVPAPAPAPVVPAPAPAPSPSPSMVPAVPPTSSGVPAAPVLQSAGFMCGLLISVCVFIL